MKTGWFMLIAAAMWLCRACVEDNFALPDVPVPEPELSVVSDSSLTALTVSRILGEWEVVDGWGEYTDPLTGTLVHKNMTEPISPFYGNAFFIEGLMCVPYINPYMNPIFYLSEYSEYYVSEDIIVAVYIGAWFTRGPYISDRYQVVEVDDKQMKLRHIGEYDCEFVLKRVKK